MMLTRCPGCATAFRVTPEQLKVRQGKVRCGKCATVFNALESLADEAPETVWGMPSPPPAAQGMAAIVPDRAIDPAEPQRQEPALPSISEAETAVSITPLAEPEPTEPTVAATPAWQAEAEQLLHDVPQAQRRRWPWWVASLCAAALLAIQAAVHFRTDLAAQVPETKPALLAICALFDCKIELPRTIDSIGIEASDLVPDKEQPGNLQLTATLRNRAPYAQVWPYLEVSLTDATDRTLLRRALAPNEYLPASAPAAGFPPRAEQTIQLALQANDVAAVGYRLYVFYP
jgi:predicted Zn finger-like uncharacterized protein